MNMLGLLAAAAPDPEKAEKLSMLGLLPTLPMGAEVGGLGLTGYNPSTANWAEIAKQTAMSQYGYSPQDWSMLDSIIQRESNWNPNAVNASSGAYGIPQILPKAHPNVQLQNDPMGQIQWLLNYINQRYGGIQQAYQHKNAIGWY